MPAMHVEGQVGRSADYVIVGAGSAGCVLANRLSASGKHSVVLIEAGGRDNSFWVDVPAGIAYLLANPSFIWPNLTRRTSSFANRSLAMVQGKMLGGSSSINGMFYIRGQSEDYDRWAELGCTGWSWDEVLPYFKRAECFADGDEQIYGKHGELKLSWISDRHHSATAFLHAALESGIPANADVNGGNQLGIGTPVGTIYGGRRQSTAKAFLGPAAGRKNLQVITSCLVRRVIFDQGRAVGVELETGASQRQIIRCNKEVILSAGAIGSPHILQHSGVGDAERLQSLGIPVVLNAPGVGQNLQDHLFAHVKFAVAKEKDSKNSLMRSKTRMAMEGLRWLVTKKGELNTTSAQIVGFIKSQPAIATPDLQIVMRPYSFHALPQGGVRIDKVPAITASAVFTRPYSRGFYQIDSADPRERGMVDANYLADERDVDALVTGIAKVREIMRQKAIANLIANEIEPGSGAMQPKELGEYIRRTASTVYHPVGTCRMGSDQYAVVDPQLRVKGVRCLRIIDASVMPTITSGNTNAPTIMIGEKGADMVLADA